jgi:hypothetical protein
MLWKGRIYKCSTSALVQEAWSDHGGANAAAWKEYFDHAANGSIDLQSDPVAISHFANNFGHVHAICKQCPTAADTNSVIEHRVNVIQR